MNNPEIRMLQALVSNAALQVQTLVELLEGDADPREQAKMALNAAELAEEAIRRTKTPLRRLARRK